MGSRGVGTMKFLILGAGALGGYYGGLLLKGGANVTFLARPKTAARLKKNGLKMRLENENFQTPVKVITADKTDTKYDVIILTCKSYDLQEAIEVITPALGTQSAVLPILNGINHIDILQDRFGPNRLLGGVTQFLVNQADDGTILPTSHGSGGQKTYFGEIVGGTSERSRAILNVMRKTMPDVELSEEILKELWNKFSGAASSFAVASLLQVRAGKVAATSAGQNVVSTIFDECAAICEAEGYPPPAFLRKVLVHDLWGKQNSDYGPSLLADIENMRPTEGVDIVGDLVSRGKKHKVHTPLLEAALCRLQLYELDLVGQ